MMPMFPPGMPPEDMQAYLDEQERQRAYQHRIQQWYEGQQARLEVEHRERVLKFQAILCNCLDPEPKPCPVHSGVMVTLDGSRVL